MDRCIWGFKSQRKKIWVNIKKYQNLFPSLTGPAEDSTDSNTSPGKELAKG